MKAMLTDGELEGEDGERAPSEDRAFEGCSVSVILDGTVQAD